MAILYISGAFLVSYLPLKFKRQRASIVLWHGWCSSEWTGSLARLLLCITAGATSVLPRAVRQAARASVVEAAGGGSSSPRALCEAALLPVIGTSGWAPSGLSTAPPFLATGVTAVSSSPTSYPLPHPGSAGWVATIVIFFCGLKYSPLGSL